MSGLSFLSNLVERIVAAQIRSHIDFHDLGNTFQSAYNVGHSTETALLCIKHEIHLSLSKGMNTALVLLDLSKAFDTIDHDTLLSCLSARFGFAGTALKWFQSESILELNITFMPMTPSCLFTYPLMTVSSLLTV